MSNPIQKAIADVKFKIPREILNVAFIQNEFGQRPLPVVVDAMIREHVIEARVKPDCDLGGGSEVVINLTNVTPEYFDQFSLIYRIPKNLTQNRSISRVISMSVGTGSAMGSTNMGLHGYSPMLDAAAGVFAAQAPIPLVSTAYLRLIAENTVLVTDNMALPRTVHLRCYLENESEFGQLRSTTYQQFSRLVELATKAHIYNVLAIPIGQGQLSGGMELGKFREIVDGYADANELYDQYLTEVFRRVMILDDSLSRERHLRMLVGRH